MKLSKEASRLFAEYQKCEDEGLVPTYLSDDRINDTFCSIRRIREATDDIFGQVVYTILEQSKLV